MGAAASPPELRGERIVLRRARAEQAQAIFDLVNTPEVLAWWVSYPMEQVLEDLTPDDEEFVIFTIELDGPDGPEVVGLVQYGQELDPMYRHASIDVSIHPDHHRRGFATDAIRTLARHLLDDLGHHRITIDPAAHNARAIACYEGLGFRPVGIMRDYEQGPDGTFHDGLLMDLLAGELR